MSASASDEPSAQGDGRPPRMADHWVWRRGWRAGRRKYAFHVTFDEQPAVHQLAAGYQQVLRGLDGLDLVPLRWLHLTVQSVGFIDEVSAEDAETILRAAQGRLAELPAPQVTLGPAIVTPEAILLVAEPADALAPARAAIREAILDVWPARRLAGGEEWQPHVTVAYSNGDGLAARYQAALAEPGRAPGTAQISVAAVQLIILGRNEHVYEWSVYGTAPLRA
jgi:2'-5' RNA ligase